MNQKTTRLSYLMSRLGIRVSILAAQTGIDKTLVSRWKNGRRRLAAHNDSMRKIVDYLLSCDQNEEMIAQTLLAHGLNEDTGSVSENLAFWLSEQDIPILASRAGRGGDTGKQYTANFTVYLGNRGLQSAIITLIDYAMSLPGPQDIICVIRGNYNWITGNPAFCDLLLSRLPQAFENGVTFTTVSRDDFSPDEIAFFSGPWLAAHLRGYVKSYYYKEEDFPTSEKIMMAAQNSVCLRLTDDPAAPDGLYIGMFTDEITVRQVYNACLEYQRRARTQFRYNYFSNPGAFLKSLSIPGVLRARRYLFSHVPTFGTFAITNVHKHVRLARKNAQEDAQKFSPLFYTPDQCQAAPFVRHIYCADSISQLCVPGRKDRNVALSAIYAKKVAHTRGLLKEQLENIRRWLLAYDNYDAVFLPQRLFDKIPLEFITVQDYFTTAWLDDASRSACVKDKNKTAALFRYADILWSNIPDVYKNNRNKKIRQIDQWLADLEAEK